MTKIVCISDVHTKFKNIVIEPCDILISTGDYSYRGDMEEVIKFHRWLNIQPAIHIISVQGNHELNVEKYFKQSKEAALKECSRVHFIDEGLLEIEGLKIWCSAITPWFHSWAWNRHRGTDIKKHWDKIPLDIDILACHGPVYGILDEVPPQYRDFNEDLHVGCKDLLNKIKELKQLKLVTCGHIHHSYGQYLKDGVYYFNASICDEQYKPVNSPIVVEL